MKQVVCLVSLIWLGLVDQISGNSAGAPSGQCGGMTPGHGFTPQTGASPFKITAYANSTSPGQSIQVAIEGTGGNTFKGFMIQARRADPSLNQDEGLGSWTASVPNTQTVCPGNVGLTHQSPSSPFTSLNLTWTAPASAVGHIQFWTTFVKSYNTYWVKEKSAIVYDPTAPAIAPATKPQKPTKGPLYTLWRDGPIKAYPQRAANDPQPSTGAIDTQQCGNSKGCYRDTDQCTEFTCQYLLTWEDKGSTVKFEMMGRTDMAFGYVAVGFSLDTLMGQDSVLSCGYFNTQIQVKQSYNNGKSNGLVSNVPNDLFSQITGSYSSGRISCSFERKKTEQGSQEIFDLASSQSYYLLMAKGSYAGGTVNRHSLEAGKYPIVSPSRVSMSAPYVSIHGQYKYPLVKIHGCLMIIAWVMMCSVAIIMARYYKPMWPNDSLCGKAIWFSVHRGCQVVTLLCTVAGFIVIFIHGMGYINLHELPNKAHPPLGIVVTILCILNPLLALCRCKPDHNCRPVFNWIHWFIGTVAFVLQTPTIFIGLSLPKAQVPWWLTWVMVAFLLFHIIVELMLEIHGCLNYRKNKNRTEEFEMRKKQDPQGELSEAKPDPVGTRFKTIMLVLYVTVVIVLGLVMVIVIAVS